MIVAIDGPVAAGKTTVARRLAARLGYLLLDTGAIYRCVALSCRQHGVDFGDTERIRELATDVEIEFRWQDGLNRVLLAGKDVTDEIRTQAISTAASQVSALPAVRGALLDLQRNLAGTADVVAEGRDIGTVVFPRAEVKIFLTAEPHVRAARRRRELVERGETSSIDEVLAALQERDQRDRNRPVAPLLAAPDAIEIDSSHLDVTAVVDFVVARVEAVGACSS